jgi:Na+/H+ antiporter NhaD/arsenite permease-like protein
VIHQAALDLGVDPLLMVFGLVVGACLGGNITPVGASANIVAVGMLRRFGHDVEFREFIKIGLPFTLAATAAGAAFLWLVWG